MEFGLFFLMQRDEQWSEAAVYDSALEQMLAAEALGYSSAWIAEARKVFPHRVRMRRPSSVNHRSPHMA